MADNHKIKIAELNFAVKELMHPSEKVFKDVLGADWWLSFKLVPRLNFPNMQSLRNVSDLIVKRTRTTVRCENFHRKVLVRVKTNGHQTLFENLFDGNSSLIFSDSDTLVDPLWRGEISFYVSPENFFYFKCSQSNSVIETRVNFCAQTIFSSLVSDLSELYEGQEHSDVVIQCGDQVFKAHKAILASRSPVFAAMFRNEMKENIENRIEIKDMAANVLSIMLEFIYCGKINQLDTETAGGLLSAAEQYQLTSLKKACVTFLLCYLSEDNVLSTLILADQYDKNLREASIDFLSREFDHIKNTENWKSFSHDRPVLANEVLLNIIDFAHSHGHKLK